MSLSGDQRVFSYNVGVLLMFIYDQGWSVSIDYVKRSPEEQKRLYDAGKSKTMKSAHLDKLAIDLNFFDPASNLVYTKERLQKFGDYWESLNDLNTWGGNWDFYDPPHFEMKRS